MWNIFWLAYFELKLSRYFSGKCFFPMKRNLLKWIRSKITIIVWIWAHSIWQIRKQKIFDHQNLSGIYFNWRSLTEQYFDCLNTSEKYLEWKNFHLRMKNILNENFLVNKTNLFLNISIVGAWTKKIWFVDSESGDYIVHMNLSEKKSIIL